MATAFDMEADSIAARGAGDADATKALAASLFAIGRAYDRAAVLMEAENRRQVGATPLTDPNAV
jgi:hypothetical protein